MINPLKTWIKSSRSKDLNEKKNQTKQRKCIYFIDVETNISAKRIDNDEDGEAVSIGIARLNEHGQVEKVYYKEFKPKVTVDLEAYRTHRLSNNYLRLKDGFSAGDADEINDYLKDSKDCCAHNAKFDKDVLQYQFDLAKCPFFPSRNLTCT